jgi:hypothetical protein
MLYKMLSPIKLDSLLSSYPLDNSAILHLGLLPPERWGGAPRSGRDALQTKSKINFASNSMHPSCSLRELGMSPQQPLNRSHNDGDECAARSSSEYVRQKNLRIRRMKIRFNTGKSQKKLAAYCSAQCSHQRIAENSQMEMFRSACHQVARGNATHDLENQTGNIHENISSFWFCITSTRHSRIAVPTAYYSRHANGSHGGSRKETRATSAENPLAQAGGGRKRQADERGKIAPRF